MHLSKDERGALIRFLGRRHSERRLMTFEPNGMGMARVCAKCGAPNPEDAAFCMSCGVSFGQAVSDLAATIASRIAHHADERRSTDRRVSRAWTALPVLAVGLPVTVLATYVLAVEFGG